jgi:hypothetical protein
MLFETSSKNRKENQNTLIIYLREKLRVIQEIILTTNMSLILARREIFIYFFNLYKESKVFLSGVKYLFLMNL